MKEADAKHFLQEIAYCIFRNLVLFLLIYFVSLAKGCLDLLITGHRLDTLARMALWDVGLDYLHGTGHGIGSFLNVHEGTWCVCVRVRAWEGGIARACKFETTTTKTPEL